MNRKIELIAPAGDFEKLKTALRFGADAVYFGGDAFSLRARAGNFDDEGLKEAVKYCRENGAKAYIAVNVIARNADLAALPAYLSYIKGIGADAAIVSDPGVFVMAKAVGLDIHISTQANVTNIETARFWRDMGARRIVLARELSLAEISEIHAALPDLELEAFCHGAMCVSYSGRCLLSDYMTGRSANRGECAQPCRYEYTLMEKKRRGEYFPIADSDGGAYILSPKDLRMAEFLPQMLAAGITGLKIEGRVKTAFYAAAAVKAYRAALNDLAEGVDIYAGNIPSYIETLNMPSNREFHSGFFFGKPFETSYRHEEGGYVRTHEYAGIAEEISGGLAKIRVKGKIAVGGEAVWLAAVGENTRFTIDKIFDGNNKPIGKATIAGTAVYIPAPRNASPGDILAGRLNPETTE